MRRISTSEITQIRFLYAKGHSLRHISKAMGVSHVTVKRYVCPDCEQGDGSQAQGRPRALTAGKKKYLTRQFERGVFRSTADACNEVRSQTDRTVSRWTIARMLSDQGLNSYSKPKKPLLLPRHKKLRLWFAKTGAKHSNEDWQRVIFTDECKVCIQCGAKVLQCWGGVKKV